MAAVTRVLCTGGPATFSYTFDDVSGLISTLIENNPGPAGTMTVDITDPSTGAHEFGTPRTIAVGVTNQSFDVSALNLHMVFQAGTGHAAGTSGWVLPFNVTCQWSSA